MTDAKGVPLVAQLTVANVNDVMQLEPMVAAGPAVAGRPRRKPGVVQGDRAYWFGARHVRLRAQGVIPVVAKRTELVAMMRMTHTARGRPIVFGP